jgi:Mg/Co/Ni transporter MgtE
MNRFNALSLDFLASKPQAAAGVLQSISTAQAASYLEEVPVRTLAPVLQNMETWPAARILDLLPLEKNIAIFSQLEYQSVAALLRLQSPKRRSDLLEQLPGKLSRPLMLSLAYQDNTVGAWMDMSTPHFFEDLSAWECLALLKKIEKPFGCSLTIIDKKHHIVGVVTLDVLLLSPDEKELGQLMDSRVSPLPAEMSLKMAKNSQDWHSHSVLPVRSSHGTYLGTLSRTTLRTALQASQPTQNSAPGDSLLAQLGSAMVSSAAGLLALSSVNKAEGARVDWQQGDAPNTETNTAQSATADWKDTNPGNATEVSNDVK